MKQSLHVVDSRTGQSSSIPIQDGDYVLAEDIVQIVAPNASTTNGENGVQAPRSLRILDKGFQHTACMESRITFVYVMCYRY